MEISDRIQNYLSLLEIRQKSRRWNVIFLGGIFIISILTTFALGLVNGLNGRSVYLITGIEIALGLSFIVAWVRLEIVRNSIELLNNLRP
jgi:uncharacterized membrane protein